LHNIYVEVFVKFLILSHTKITNRNSKFEKNDFMQILSARLLNYS